MYIKKFTVNDSLTLLAQTCKMEFSPKQLSESPLVEYAFSQDTNHISVSDVRPNGAMLTLSMKKDDAPFYNVLTALVEYVDDFTDPDVYSYGCDLSQMPFGHPHRRKVSFIFNSYESLERTTHTAPPDGSLTNHGVIKKVCGLAGVQVGRLDLPVVSVVGTIDIINQSPVEVAKSMCEPFNMFEFVQYYVRCDQNGLQIICVDYTKSLDSTGYTLPTPKSVHRSWEMYMPENRLGSNDVFLIGATIPGITLLTPKRIYRQYNNVTTTESDVYADGVTSTLKKVTTQSNLIFMAIDVLDVEFGIDTGIPDYLQEPGTVIDKALTSALPDIEGLQGYDFTIAASFVVETISSMSDSINGLLNEVTSSNVFKVAPFAKNKDQQSEIFIKTIPTWTEEERVLFPNGTRLPETLTRTVYGYDNVLGEQVSTNTTKYFWLRDAWILQSDDTVSNPAIAAETLGSIPGGQGSPTGLQSPSIDQIVRRAADYQPQTAYQESTIPTSNYMLFNGQSWKEYWLNGSELYSYQGNTTDPAGTRFAFTRTFAYMNYSGLTLVYGLCARQKELEKKNPYWETVKVTVPGDFTPVAGCGAIVNGSAGIVQSVVHEGDPDSVTSTIVLKRLIVGAS